MFENDSLNQNYIYEELEGTLICYLFLFFVI
jgi:hypothetical protein